MQTEEQKKKRKKVLKIVGALVGVFLLIGCCGVGGLAFLGSEPTPTTTATNEEAIATAWATYLPTSTTTHTPTPRPTWTPQPTEVPESRRTEARVTEVVDGDTIKVEIDETIYTVRYIGIDTPETVHPSKPVEWMGLEAFEANQDLVGDEIVYLEKDVSETDRYGRLLLYVFLADGLFVNAELVRLGYAQVSTYPPDVRYEDLFLEMQQEAREAESGLWAASTPTPISPTAPPVVQPTQQPLPTVAPTEPPAPPTTSPSWWMCPNNTEGAAYVGSVQSDPLKFHGLSCHWAGKISAANRICFASRQVAIDLGYRPCKVCKP